ncbi:MAG: hypothetical protein HZB51_09970 [Chloroflexi bacterium]|nr:hypothetical protein [Chloroflexota bacterium]
MPEQDYGMSVMPRLVRSQRGALIIGISALIATMVGAFTSPAQFFPAFLFAYIFWIGLTLGCLALTMLHDLAGGAWGVIMLRFLEAGMSTLPLMLILFGPNIFGLLYLYPWANVDQVARDPLLLEQYPYLNVPFFLIRAAIYFIVWMALAYVLRRWSLELDRADNVALVSKLKRLSAIGLALFVLTSTFAMIDWVMTLEPHWFSTVYAAMLMMGAVLSAFAFVIVLVVWLGNQMTLAGVNPAGLLNDLGSLLLAFVMLWAYLAFSQYLIIYSGNLVHEIPWYVNRLQGGWEWIALGVMLFQFVLPFVYLLFRDLKRHGILLAFVALLLVVARAVDVFWLIQPAFSPSGFSIHWLHFTAWGAIGGLWFAMFAWRLTKHPLVPLREHTTPLREIATEQS